MARSERPAVGRPLREFLAQRTLLQRLLIVEAVVLGVVLLGTILTARWFASDLRSRIEGERLRATTSLTGEIDELLRSGSMTLRVAAEWGPDQQALTRLAAESSLFSAGIVVVDEAGKVSAASDLSPLRPGDSLARELGKADVGVSRTLGWGFRPDANGPPLLAIAVPVLAEDQPAGAAPGFIVGLVDSFDSAVAVALRRAKQVGETGHADIVDGRSTTVSSTELEHILRQADHPTFYAAQLSDSQARTVVARTPYEDGDDDDDGSGEDHVMGFGQLTVLPWGVALGGDASETYAPIERLWLSVLALMSGVGALALGVTFLGSAQLVRPVRELSESAERVAAGELDAPLVVNEGGEIGQLARSIDAMRDSLHSWALELDDRVNARTAELARRTNDLAASAAIARVAAHSLDLGVLLSEMAAEIEQQLDVDGVVVFVGGDGSRTHAMRASPGVPLEFSAVLRPCARCLLRSDALAAPVMRWEPTGQDDACFGPGFRSVLPIPIHARDRQAGTICLLRRKDDDVSVDARFMNLLATEVGIGIENALLYEDVRWREEHRQRLLAKVLSAQEDERGRLARELHDDTGQALIALMFGVDGLAAAVTEQPIVDDARSRLAAQIASLRDMSEEALGNLRRMVMALRPTALDDLGLVPAIERYGEFMLRPVGIAVSVESDLGDGRLPADCEIAVFRIVQEALNNVARHSHATKSYVELRREGGWLTVRVTDNGAGMSLGGSDDPLAGVGIEGMEERATLLGGELRISSQRGAGTTVELVAPVGDDLERASV